MELGVYTFADVAGQQHPGERLRNLVEEIEVADQAGLDVFGVGEHHRPDYAVSAPVVALAAAATRTQRIRLTSAVTVLSSDDPIRVYQQFATLDGLSNGRAEIMVGRGSFIESFPLFGYDLADYDTLFSEKLDAQMELRRGTNGIHPRPVQRPIPLWIAVGGTPQSVVRAATLGVPMALAIIGGDPRRFTPFFDLYRDVWSKTDKASAGIRLSLNMHGFVSETVEHAQDLFFPAHNGVMNRIGKERGWPPSGRAQFDAACGPHGHLIIGDARAVTERILALYRLFRPSRLLIQMAIGDLPHRDVLRAIEILGTQVAPAVRAAIAEARHQE